MIVVRKKPDPCLSENGHAWSQLEDGVKYRVIGIEYDMYRIQTTNHDWKPCLYSVQLFDVIDPTVEPEWVIDMSFEYDGELNLYIGFPEFEETGFWEKVHDNHTDVLQTLIPIFDRLKLTYPF